MTITLLIIATLTYTLVLWLGLYLMARNPASLQLRYAGLGLLFYALALAGEVLSAQASSPELALRLTRLGWPLLFLPALFWFGATVYRLPETMPLRDPLQTVLNRILIPTAIPFYLVSAATNLVFDFNQAPPQPGPTYVLFAIAVLLPMLAACLLVMRLFALAEPKKPLGLLLLATLFFGLSAVLLVLPFNWLPRAWFLLGVSLDFMMLGLVIALLDAFDEGETLLPHFLRSLLASILAVILFGGAVALTMAWSTGLTFAMLGLLFITLTVAILTQTFADPIQTFLDNVTFGAFPRLRRARADLRNLASVLPRVNESLKLEKLDDEEFTRLTRRALSHMGNLPRMASNPLTRLPVIDKRLAERNADDNTLERAAELKRLLAESIARLKPPSKGEFGASEEWRFYNALYFPYVIGLRPYSRRIEHDGLDPASQEALAWFRTYIPERTLYNWQNAAAKLVAQDLRERMN
jgi:hypothetical protein